MQPVTGHRTALTAGWGWRCIWAGWLGSGSPPVQRVLWCHEAAPQESQPEAGERATHSVLAGAGHRGLSTLAFSGDVAAARSHLYILTEAMSTSGRGCSQVLRTDARTQPLCLKEETIFPNMLEGEKIYCGPTLGDETRPVLQPPQGSQVEERTAGAAPMGPTRSRATLLGSSRVAVLGVCSETGTYFPRVFKEST